MALPPKASCLCPRLATMYPDVIDLTNDNTTALHLPVAQHVRRQRNQPYPRRPHLVANLSAHVIPAVVERTD
jgi:hypothetical protein